MTRSHLVGRNILSMAITQIVTWGISTFTMLYLPSYVGDVGLGRLTLASSVAGLAAIFMVMGTATVLTRDVARDHQQAKDYLTAALIQRLVFGLAVSLVVLAGCAFQPLSETAVLILITTAVSVIVSLSAAVAEVLRGLENFPRQNVATILEKASFAVVLLLAIRVKAPLWALAAGGGLSATASLLVNLSAFNTGFVIPRRRHWRLAWELVREGMPFFAGAVFMTVYSQCYPILLSWISGDAAVGWYGLVTRLFGTALFIASIVSSAMLPAITRLRAEDPGAFPAAARRMVRLMLVFASPIAAVIIFMPEQLIRILGYPPAFMNAIPVFVVFGIGLVLWFLSMAVGTLLTCMDLQKEFGRASATAAVLVIPSAVLCICVTERLAHNGAVGAAISQVSLELYILTRLIRALPSDLLGFGDVWDSTVKLALSSLPMGLLLAFTPPHFAAISFTAGFAIYIAMSCALRCVRPEDIHLARNILRRRTEVTSPA